MMCAPSKFLAKTCDSRRYLLVGLPALPPSVVPTLYSVPRFFLLCRAPHLYYTYLLAPPRRTVFACVCVVCVRYDTPSRRLIYGVHDESALPPKNKYRVDICWKVGWYRRFSMPEIHRRSGREVILRPCNFTLRTTGCCGELVNYCCF